MPRQASTLRGGCLDGEGREQERQRIPSTLGDGDLCGRMCAYALFLSFVHLVGWLIDFVGCCVWGGVVYTSSFEVF